MSKSQAELELGKKAWEDERIALTEKLDELNNIGEELKEVCRSCLTRRLGLDGVQQL